MARGVGFQDLFTLMVQFSDWFQKQPRQLPLFAHPGHFEEGLEICILGSLQFRASQEDRFPQDESTVLRLARTVVTLQAGKFAYLGPDLVHEIVVGRRFEPVCPRQRHLQADGQKHHEFWLH